MEDVYSRLLDNQTPLVFADGTSVYKKIAATHIVHKQGFFIMAPSGVGKTYFVDHQKEKHWIDGDKLWEATNAHPRGPWWLESLEVINEIDARSDIVTMQAKKLGFWIMGASNNWLKPDAIVLPHWSTHVRYIKYRESHDYDGGAKSDRLQQVLHHRAWIRRWVKLGVPQFKSVQEATDYLSSTIR